MKLIIGIIIGVLLNKILDIVQKLIMIEIRKQKFYREMERLERWQ